jgi:prepilin-type N-terminal cleavage/methylation domain-containing protein
LLSPRQSGSPHGQPNAFTLTELLVVIVTIAILAALLLPALAGPQIRDQQMQCLSNLQQLQIGWTSYAADNNGKLAQNVSIDWGGWDGNLGDLGVYGPGQSEASWILGDATNAVYWQNLIEYGLIYPYVGNCAFYQCPANVKLDQWGLVTWRAYSMNAWMDGAPPWKVDQHNFTKLATIGSYLPPAMAWVFMEENQSTINDGSLVEDVPQNEPAPAINYWVDLPGHYHFNAGSMAFADGHCETRNWTDRSILADMPLGPQGNIPADSSSPDIFWVLARTTVSLIAP